MVDANPIENLWHELKVCIYVCACMYYMLEYMFVGTKTGNVYTYMYVCMCVCYDTICIFAN